MILYRNESFSLSSGSAEVPVAISSARLVASFVDKFMTSTLLLSSLVSDSDVLLVDEDEVSPLLEAVVIGKKTVEADAYACRIRDLS